MRGTLMALVMVAMAVGQDARNTNIPNTDTHFAMPAYRTLAEWEARRTQLRRQILSAAGLDPMPEKNPLHAHIFGRIEREGYSIEKVYLETMPGFFLGGNLYRPTGRHGKSPAILIAHGHWTYGRLENQDLNSTPTQGITMAKQGYVVFAYDMVGYNDTAQLPHDFGGRREELWSFGPLAIQLWDSIRALDFVSGLEDVDPEKIGITGASGGGTQTMLLAAVDDRIHFAAPVNMVSAIMQGGCVCENAPGLRMDTSNVEIAALTAPRPMILISGPQDWTKNVPDEEYPAIQKIYGLFDRAANVSHGRVNAPHNYNRESREHVYRFLAKHVLGAADPESYKERDEERIENLQDMLVFQGRSLPAGALDYDQLFSGWRERASRAALAETRPEVLRERLATVLHSEFPAAVDAQPSGSQVILRRPGKGDRVPVEWTPGRGRPALVVHPGGITAARATPFVQQLLAAGRPVLLIDTFQTGSCVAPRDRNAPHFLTFNVSDDAGRVQDILTGLAYLRQREQGPVELTGLEHSSLWALFAAALAPGDVILSHNETDAAGDEELLKHFFVPGIQHAGGTEIALRILKSRKPPAASAEAIK